MYYFGDKPATVEGYDEDTMASAPNENGKKNKWLLPVGIGVGVLVVVGVVVMMMRKKKQVQKFGFKFY